MSRWSRLGDAALARYHGLLFASLDSGLAPFGLGDFLFASLDSGLAPFGLGDFFWSSFL